jgi:hypothetical protein
VTVEPTCVETGVKTYTCTVCKETKTETIAALGHEFKTTEAKAATCTEVGWEAYNTCTRCDYTTYKELPALGHSYGEWKITAPATCAAKGVETRVCSNDNSHTETRETDKIAHTIVTDEAVAATCTKTGLTSGSHCSVCNEVITVQKEVEALGHEYSDSYTVDKEATATEVGSKSRHCIRCDSKTDITTIPVTGHSWNDGEVTKEPTCEETGVITYTCTECKETTTETIAVLGHDYSTEYTVDKAATCAEVGSKSRHCTRCNSKTDVTEIPLTEHSWNDGEETKEPTCVETGVKTYTCTVCKETKTEVITALGHD